LSDLKDLAGVRVLAFPPSRWREAESELSKAFPEWTPDPVRIDDESADYLAFKYYGLCETVSTKVSGEVQIVPTSIGAFWEVEHSAIYKPTLELKGVARHPEMGSQIRDVYQALRAFEEKFEKLIALDMLKG
jgi:hypothetical protein